MTNERRGQQRVHCFLSTSAPQGEVIIDELTSEGGRLTAAFPVAQGDRLPLTIHKQGGGEIPLEIRVGRVWKSPVGYRMGWTFGSDAASRRQAGRLFSLVSGASLPAEAGARHPSVGFRRPF